MWFKLTGMRLAEVGSCLLKQSENEFRNVWCSKYQILLLRLLTKVSLQLGEHSAMLGLVNIHSEPEKMWQFIF